MNATGDRADRTPDEPQLAPEMRVRDVDLEPHAGLRYIAWLFKVLAILMILVLIAEIAIGLRAGGAVAMTTLMVEATRLVVFAAFLWAAGDMALMFVESNHDLRALRILMSRMSQRSDPAPPAPTRTRDEPPDITA